MPAFTILDLNIEGDNHLELVQQLLLEKQPDIFCVQEIFRSDLPVFEKLLQVRGYFVPMCRVETENPYRLQPKGEWGLAIFSRKPAQAISYLAYVGELNHVPLYVTGDPNAMNRALILATFSIENKTCSVATTHFTWTNHGRVSDLQRQHVDVLLSLLKPHRPLLLCGDFNAPRGKEIFDRIADTYQDNIPTTTTTTIDQQLHRVHDIEFVVDGMFSSPELRVGEVEVIDGVSDHQALWAKVEVL